MEVVIGTKAAKELLIKLAAHFKTPQLKFIHLNRPSKNKGEYYGDLIIIYGKITAEAVLHEFAHHIHDQKFPYNKQTHNLSFFRICFELRDWFLYNYGVTVCNVCGYTQMKSYQKALSEWVFSKSIEKCQNNHNNFNQLQLF